MRFTEFLIEEKEEDKLKNFEHVEDHVIHSGHTCVPLFNLEPINFISYGE